MKFTALSYRHNFLVPALTDTQRLEGARALGIISEPEGYGLRAVMRGEVGENFLAAYFNAETGQKLVVAQIREHLRDQSFILMDKTKVARSFDMEYVEIPHIPALRIMYQLPVFSRRDDLLGIGSEAIVKGIRLQSQDHFETEATYVTYFKGEFEKIGLFKAESGKYRCPTPVFDFDTLHEGALGFVTSKVSGRVIVCVGVNSLGQFREQEFRDFLHTLRPA